jgi:hypothetical protein
MKWARPAGGVAMLRNFITGVGLLLAVSTVSPAMAQPAGDQVPPNVRALVRLLGDPAVQEWLKTQEVTGPAAASSPAEAAASPSDYLAQRIAALHQHLDALAGAWPTLPEQFAAGTATLRSELQGGRLWHVLILVALSGALGVLAERLLRSSALGITQWMQSQSQTATRVKAAGFRLAAAVAQLLAFAVGSFLVFAVIGLPPLAREVLAGYLFVFVLARGALLLCRFLTAPDDEPLRLISISGEAALHWSRRIAIMVGWFAFGWVTAALLARLGFNSPGRQLVAYALGLVLLALWLEAVWRRPGRANGPARSHQAGSLLLSAYGLLLWLLWAAGMMPAFWLVVFAFVLPTALRLAGQAVARLTQPAADAGPESQAATAYRVLAERGLRAALIIGAVLLLAHAWNFDLTSLTANDTVGTRLLRGIVSAIILFLAADIAWRIIRALIDYKIKEGTSDALPAEARRSRLKTLLPILRNVLFVVLFTMAGLMVLSSMAASCLPMSLISLRAFSRSVP